MDKNEIQQLIAEMPFTDAEKAELLTELQATTSPETVLAKIGSLLNTKESETHASYPEGAAAYAAIKQQYEAEVKTSEVEFNQKMDKLEKDAEVMNREVADQLDHDRQEELKEQIQSL